ncbi:hypothetical protein E2562_021975 [Oryza meyeriana var. granulata]|uniref:Uncharacterized protein n=1 Tax=Oryza meyeriana var. granulata TaxID=110450 RepID=A0A6G1DLL4_9ORYZ|nr:hypothetical protein E2562_021975 [Oryza meyeriana var. granulata]
MADGRTPLENEVLLRRRDGPEEFLVSAVLEPLRFEGGKPLPRDALMKVFVSKPGVKPVLRFDCRAFADECYGGLCDLIAVSYHSFAGDDGEDKYEGPEFSYGWNLRLNPASIQMSITSERGIEVGNMTSSEPTITQLDEG